VGRTEGLYFQVEVAGEQFVQGRGRVEAGDTPGAVELVAHIVKPRHLAVGRVQERHAEFTLVLRHLADALGVALRLDEHALRAEGHLLGLDDATNPITVTERVVSRTRVSLELLDGSTLVSRGIGATERNDRPASTG
jgi:hypothetical protein